MDEHDRLDARLRAVERALSDGEQPLLDLSDQAALTERADDLIRRVTTAEERLQELDAAVQALRGYVGNVRAVNTDVERRADSALAAVEALEKRVDAESHPSISDPRAPVNDPRSTVCAPTNGAGPQDDEITGAAVTRSAVGEREAPSDSRSESDRSGVLHWLRKAL